MYLFVAVVTGILTALFAATLIAATDSEILAGTFSAIAGTLSSLITLPVSAAVVTVLYFELRARKEGFDLPALARGVGSDIGVAETSPEAVAAASGLGPGGFAPPRPPEGGAFAPAPEHPPEAPPPQDDGKSA